MDETLRYLNLAASASNYGKRDAGEEATRKYAESCSLNLRTMSLRDDVSEIRLTVAGAEVGDHISNAYLGKPVRNEALIWKAAKDKRSRTYFWDDAQYMRVTTLGGAGALLIPELVELCEPAARVRAAA